MANLVTIFRLLLVPVLVLLIISKNNYLAFGVFILAALTDWLDGYLARATASVSDLGKLADPLVDRIFIAATLISLFVTRKIPPFWALALIIGRDFLLILGYKLLDLKKRIRIPVSQLGKLTTACLIFSLALLILHSSLGWWIFYLGLSLSFISGLDYIRRGIVEISKVKSTSQSQN